MYYYPNLAVTVTSVGPGSLSATSVSPNEIDLSWQGYSSSIYNTVDILASTDGVNFTYFDSVNSSQTSYQATGLLAGTAYSFEVEAADSNGDVSTPTNAASATTAVDPWRISAATNSASLGGVTEGGTYYLDLSTNPQANAPAFGQWTVDWGDGSQSSVYTAQDMTASHVFAYGTSSATIQVAATTASGASVPLTVTAQPIAVDVIPLAPSYVNATPVSSTEIDITWPDLSNAATGYDILRAVNGGPFDEIASVSPDTGTFADDNLDASDTVQYEVEAMGAYSDTGVVAATPTETTDVSTPTGDPAITSLVRGPNGTGSVILTWTYQGNDDAGFEIEAEDQTANGNFQNVGNPLPVDASGNGSTTINGLQDGDTYLFRMRADHMDGSVSDYTQNVEIEISPDGPWNLQRIYGGATWADLTWGVTTKEAYLDSWIIFDSLSPNTGFTQVKTVSSGLYETVVTGLSASTTYYFQIVGFDGANSLPATTTFTTFEYDLTPPTGVSVVSAGNQTAFNWTDTNQNPTPEALVQELVTNDLSSSGGGIWTYVDAGNGYVDYGVKYSAGALWRVRAEAYGQGSTPVWVSQYWSNPVQGTTDDTETAPTLSATPTVPGTIHLAWSDASGGYNYTTYIINCWVQGGNPPAVQVSEDGDTSDISGLAPMTRYYFSVFAEHVNAVEGGDSRYVFGPSSAVVAATNEGPPSAPAPVVIPVAPASASAAYNPGVAGGEVTISWANTPSNETKFYIYLDKTANGGKLTLVGMTTADETTCTYKPKDNGPYHFRIYAANSAGVSSSYASAYCSSIGGPDITLQLLEINREAVWEYRHRLSPDQRLAVSVWHPTEMSNNWDITDLSNNDVMTAHNKALLPDGTYTVTVAGAVYEQAIVDYYLFGVWCRLIGVDPFQGQWSVTTYRYFVAPLKGDSPADVAGRLAFFEAGYTGSLSNIDGAAIPNVQPAEAPPNGEVYAPGLSWFIGTNRELQGNSNDRFPGH